MDNNMLKLKSEIRRSNCFYKANNPYHPSLTRNGITNPTITVINIKDYSSFKCSSLGYNAVAVVVFKW